MAGIEDAVSIFVVVGSSDIKALVEVVSQIHVWSFPVSNLLVGVSFPPSHHSIGTVSETLAILSGQSEQDIASKSDGSGSMIKHEPLVVVVRVVSVNSQQVLVATDVTAAHEQSSVGCHFRSQVESDFVFVKVRWICNSVLVNDPTLISFIVAIPPGHVSVVIIVTNSTVNVKTFASVVSDCFSCFLVPMNLLMDFTLPWSDDSSITDSVADSQLV